MRITFITGNPGKAAYVAHALGELVNHHKLDLEEIQSLDQKEVVEHKAHQAYDILKTPVLVEDVALEFHALGRLPGTFIKWFVGEMGNEGLCKLLTVEHDRAATARICYALYNGQEMRFFEGSMTGSIANAPRGTNGFGWDQIFIKDGETKTRAELTEKEEKSNSMRRQPLEQLRELLQRAE
jgi:inosine triphosphate pyrophosphatase